MVAFSYALDLPSRLNNQRTFAAILFFATGGIVGWPFSLAVAIPFVLEEMFVYGKDKIKPEAYSTWIAGRWARLVQGGLLASLLFVSSAISRIVLRLICFCFCRFPSSPSTVWRTANSPSRHGTSSATTSSLPPPLVPSFTELSPGTFTCSTSPSTSTSSFLSRSFPSRPSSSLALLNTKGSVHDLWPMKARLSSS